MGSYPVQRAADTCRPSMKDMRADHRCFDITVESERSAPISLYWKTVEAALNCAHRTIYMFPPSLLVSLKGWGLIDLPLRAAFSPAHPLAGIFHPPYPPIASQSISRDVPVARARASNPFHVSLREWPRLPFTARIERAHSYRARSASKKGTWPLPPPLFDSPQGCLLRSAPILGWLDRPSSTLYEHQRLP